MLKNNPVFGPSYISIVYNKKLYYKHDKTKIALFSSGKKCMLRKLL